MDYIYSYLNDDVASREMHGSETNTAVVTVNAATNTISVDVKPISPSMLNVAKPTESGSYILQETISTLGEVSYSWATLEDYNQEVTQAIAKLTQQLEQEKQERIESVQTEANVRELADAHLQSEIEQEAQEREKSVKEEAQRTDSMINQLNDNVQSGFNTINNVLTTSINNINNAILNESTTREAQYKYNDGRIKDLNTRLGVEIGNRESWDNIIYSNLSTEIENEKRERVEQDQDIRNSIDERKSVDQHLWDILPDNIIAGTPMQGMENKNAVNIVFSKYQKHGIGEDPADAELVEVPNQAITLFPATQEVAGVLTAADKTKIDNIATDIDTAVQAEANARQEADTALENKLDSLIVVEGDAIQVGREDKELNIKTGGRFTVNSNYEVVTSEEYPGEPGRRIIPLENNDQIAGKKTDGNGVPLIFVSKWNKVEVGGSGAPLNLNSDDGTVTVNDTYELLNETDRDKLNDAIKAEKTRATQAETNINASISDVVQKATHKVIDSVAINIVSGDSASLDYTTYNPGSGTVGESSSTPIPMASSTTAGLMSSTYVNNIDNSVKKNGVAEQTVNGVLNVSGNVTVGGNLHVQGNTVTVDTETLNVADNLIVTNSDGTELEYPSGIAIKTNATSAFGIVYAPDDDELKAGIGTVDENNEFLFNPDEGNPVTLRDSDKKLTDGNILVWTNEGHKLIDSNIPATQIARKDQAQTFNGIQTFVNAIEVPSINVNGVQLTSNVAGNIAVESQITDAVNSLVNGANVGYQNFGEVESTVSAINTDLQEYKTSTNQNITQAENNISGINSNLSQMNSAIQSAQSCATSAYTYAGEANTLATNANTNITTHVADKENPHNVTAEQVGLGNVDNTSDLDKPISNATACAIACVSACVANLTTHIEDKNNPHNVTKAQVGLANVKNVDTTNASNINSGTLALNIIADGLVAPGANVAVERNATTGVYTISAVTGGETSINANNITFGTLNIARIATGLIVSGNTTTTEVSRNDTSGSYTITACVPVQSVAGKNGNVQLNKITFNGACTATYNGSSDITVTIPNVPTLHSVNLSTNNGSASTVIGNVYSSSATPIDISIPTISVVRGAPTGTGVAVVDIQVTTKGNVVTITPVLGPVNDGTL